MAKCKICKRTMTPTPPAVSRTKYPDPRLWNCGGDCGECCAESGDTDLAQEIAGYLKDQFWEKFRWLVRETLDGFRSETLVNETALHYQLQDSTSCFHPGIPERGAKKPC